MNARLWQGLAQPGVLSKGGSNKRGVQAGNASSQVIGVLFVTTAKPRPTIEAEDDDQ
jgi:hypothetical protein